MLPPAVVEQQAKLGVSAEDSKAQRLKRQQARFRDRGGAFVPSNSNPLVDILLARTVSGESPSKARPRDVTKRVSPVKGGVVAAAEDGLPVAGTSKRKPATSRRRKTKDAEPEAGTETKPVPKRRGRPAKGKRKVPDLDPDTEEPPTKPKATSKGKGKQTGAASPTSDGNPKTKKKPTTKAKSNPAKEVVEVLDSDDQTLVDVPRKSKSKPKWSTRREDEDETDDDVPVIRKRAALHGDNLKPSGAKTTRVKTEKIAGTSNSSKKAPEDGEEGLQNVKHSKANTKKRLVPHDDDDDVDASPPKKGKVAKSTSTKPKSDVGSKPELVLRTTKAVRSDDAKATGKAKRKGKVEPDHEATKDEDDERLSERITKPKKRKKEEDNYDDRPRKAVKFSESGPSHSSSQKLKENQKLDKNHKRVSKSNLGVKAEYGHEPDDDNDDDAPRLKLAAKVPSRDKMSRGPKGPPREVLERIKASAARYLPCADSEPDELDCLS